MHVSRSLSYHACVSNLALMSINWTCSRSRDASAVTTPSMHACVWLLLMLLLPPDKSHNIPTDSEMASSTRERHDSTRP